MYYKPYDYILLYNLHDTLYIICQNLYIIFYIELYMVVIMIIIIFTTIIVILIHQFFHVHVGGDHRKD